MAISNIYQYPEYAQKIVKIKEFPQKKKGAVTVLSVLYSQHNKPFLLDLRMHYNGKPSRSGVMLCIQDAYELLMALKKYFGVIDFEDKYPPVDWEHYE